MCNYLAGCILVNFLRVNMLALCLDAKKILERKTRVCDGFLTAERERTWEKREKVGGERKKSLTLLVVC
jgi:hypothetical protein